MCIGNLKMTQKNEKQELAIYNYCRQREAETLPCLYGPLQLYGGHNQSNRTLASKGLMPCSGHEGTFLSQPLGKSTRTPKCQKHTEVCTQRFTTASRDQYFPLILRKGKVWNAPHCTLAYNQDSVSLNRRMLPLVSWPYSHPGLVLCILTTLAKKLS